MFSYLILWEAFEKEVKKNSQTTDEKSLNYLIGKVNHRTCLLHKSMCFPIFFFFNDTHMKVPNTLYMRSTQIASQKILYRIHEP